MLALGAVLIIAALLIPSISAVDVGRLGNRVRIHFPHWQRLGQKSAGHVRARVWHVVSPHRSHLVSRVVLDRIHEDF